MMKNNLQKIALLLISLLGLPLLVLCQKPTIEIHQIDIGVGDATLIKVNNTDGTRAILIDAGATAANETVISYLNSRDGGNLGTPAYLDYIIASHYHEDHIGGLVGPDIPATQTCNAFGGVLNNPKIQAFALLDRGNSEPVPESLIYENYTAIANKTKRRIAVGPVSGSAGKIKGAKTVIPPPHSSSAPLPCSGENCPKGTNQQLALGGYIDLGKDEKGTEIKLYLLLANGNLYTGNDTYINLMQGSSKKNQNNFGLAWVLQYGQFRYFTGGDIGGYATSSYIDIETSLSHYIGNLYNPEPAFNPSHICAFKSDHHGSASSTNTEFLKMLKPTVCVISSGTRHDHPTQETITRMEQADWEATGLHYNRMAAYYMTELYKQRVIDLKRGNTSGNRYWIATLPPPKSSAKFALQKAIPTQYGINSGGFLYKLHPDPAEKGDQPGDIQILVYPETGLSSITKFSCFVVRKRNYKTGVWESPVLYECHAE